MMYCPLMSFAKQYSSEQQCLGKECAFAADKSGNCLVKQALQCYVTKTHLENEEKKTFTKKYVGEPYYPDDAVRPKTVIPPTEVDFGPPRLDGSYIFSKGV